VMNYLQGDTLQDFIVTARDLKRDKVFRESTIRSLFDEILRGLRIVHQHKMLHLDIKPANIYVRTDGTPVLLDFGAARQTLMAEQPILKPMYTPGFASPEQMSRREALGPWSDIYSVGASLYACLAGYAPPRSDERERADTYQPAVKAFAGRHSEQLLETIDWCLHLDPLARPQSVYTLQKALVRRGADEPMPANWFADLGSRLKSFIGRT
jgi:serine/threonine protein kinase